MRIAGESRGDRGEIGRGWRKASEPTLSGCSLVARWSSEHAASLTTRTTADAPMLVRYHADSNNPSSIHLPEWSCMH